MVKQQQESNEIARILLFSHFLPFLSPHYLFASVVSPLSQETPECNEMSSGEWSGGSCLQTCHHSYHTIYITSVIDIYLRNLFVLGDIPQPPMNPPGGMKSLNECNFRNNEIIFFYLVFLWFYKFTAVSDKLVG